MKLIDGMIVAVILVFVYFCFWMINKKPETQTPSKIEYNIVIVEQSGKREYKLQQCYGFVRTCNVMGYYWPLTPEGLASAEEKWNLFVTYTEPRVVEVVKTNVGVEK